MHFLSRLLSFSLSLLSLAVLAYSPLLYETVSTGSPLERKRPFSCCRRGRWWWRLREAQKKKKEERIQSHLQLRLEGADGHEALLRAHRDGPGEEEPDEEAGEACGRQNMQTPEG